MGFIVWNEVLGMGKLCLSLEVLKASNKEHCKNISHVYILMGYARACSLG